MSGGKRGGRELGRRGRWLVAGLPMVVSYYVRWGDGHRTEVRVILTVLVLYCTAYGHQFRCGSRTYK